MNKSDIGNHTKRKKLPTERDFSFERDYPFERDLDPGTEGVVCLLVAVINAC